MLVLNNYETQDEYTAHGTIEGLLCNRYYLSVSNNAVFVKFKISATGSFGAALWGPDVFVAPITEALPLNGLYGMQVRSAVAKTPGQVTIRMYGVHE